VAAPRGPRAPIRSIDAVDPAPHRWRAPPRRQRIGRGYSRRNLQRGAARAARRKPGHCTGRRAYPAADWLVDYCHVVEAQIRRIGVDLPPGYYRQLPKLTEGPLAEYPRVLGVAWAFVAHTDCRFDAQLLSGFVAAYQRVQPLTIGELWAIAITLRIVLVDDGVTHRVRAVLG